MTKNPPPLLLPLLIISKEKKTIGKVRIQKLVYLIQMKAKINLYHFKKHYYGPYSESLDYDLTYNPDLITVESRFSAFNPGQYYFEFRIAEEGKRKLEEFLKPLEKDFLTDLMHLVEHYCALPTNKLIEEAYSTFQEINNRIMPLQNSVEKLHSRIKEIFSRNCNRESLYVLVIVDYLKEVLGKAERITDEVQKAVISNFAEEIIHSCEEVLSEIEPPVNSERLKPKFINILELWGTLIDYCEKINLVKNPFSKNFDEVLSEDEVIRLQQVLLSLELD